MLMNKLKKVLMGMCVTAIGLALPAAGSAAKQASSPKVEYYPHAQVATAFAKGETLTQGSSGGGVYKVMTARRDGPGEVEVHSLDTDVFYIVKGSATFVTGGKVVDARNTAPNEVRGKSIQGGTPHHLSQGDILVIPHGVPHWFEGVEPPFLYLVIKVR
jgi:glc operon protein GlcG